MAPGYRNPANFVVVSDAYPTVTAAAADLVLPAAMWVEKEGAYGNAEQDRRATGAACRVLPWMVHDKHRRTSLQGDTGRDRPDLETDRL